MSIKSKVLFGLLAAGLVAVAAAPNYHRTRPCVRCSIPDREYHYGKFSQPLRSLSGGAIPMEAGVSMVGKVGASLDRSPLAAGDDRREKIKLFQFVKKPKLQIDHCSIANMAVLLHESGEWTISLRADQNPLNAQQPLNVTTSQPSRRFTDHLKRNQFHVIARCYVDEGPSRDDALLGKPLVVQLGVKPFWVQKEEPYQLFETAYHPQLQQYFELIDRVEIEFAYRRE